MPPPGRLRRGLVAVLPGQEFSADDGSDADNDPQPNKTVTIIGRGSVRISVVRASNGNAINNATVTLALATNPPGPTIAASDTGGNDHDFSGLASGTYTATVTANGFVTNTATVVVVPGATSPTGGTDGTVVALTAS